MEEASPPRSAFVTALAWAALLCSVLGLLAGSLQCVIGTAMLSGDDLERLAETAGSPSVGLLGPRLNWFGLSSIGGAIATFIAAVGLQKRRPWAWSAFIALLGLGMAGNLLSVFVVRSTFSSLPRMSEAYVFPHFNLLLGILEGLVYAALLGTTALMGWMIRRLRSDDIRREFGGQASN